MTKAIIIDDEMLARSILKEYLAAHNDIQLVAECSDGFEGLKAIHSHNPDLVFLDVQMPKITGFEMLELLENPPEIIFTTAFDEYAIKAFEANAIDYLLKPFSESRLQQSLDKWRQLHNAKAAKSKVDLDVFPAQQDRVVVKLGSKIKIIPISDVLMIESADDYVKIHTAEGHYLKHKTMSFYERTLADHNFVRVHRSYLVPVNQITKIDPYEKDGFIALLKSGHKVNVSRSGYQKLKIVLDL